jgi:RHS repeat-associated protein
MFTTHQASARAVTEEENGRRLKERIYLDVYEIYREYSGVSDNTPTLERETLHVMDDTRRVALIETKTMDTSVPATILPLRTLTRYQFDNHLGSACVEVDESGSVISYEEYYPYGSTSYQAGRSVVEVRLKRYRYAGKERDEETGLCYHGARYYAPWLGRWTSCDPIYNKNIASYVSFKMNPVVHLDPDGREPKKWQKVVVAIWQLILNGQVPDQPGTVSKSDPPPHTQVEKERSQAQRQQKRGGGSPPKEPPSGGEPPKTNKPTGPDGTGTTISRGTADAELAAEVDEILGKISGALGIVTGGFEMYEGAKHLNASSSAEDVVLSGVHIGAGGATLLGGVGTLTGIESLAVLGPPGWAVGMGVGLYSEREELAIMGKLTFVPHEFLNIPGAHFENAPTIGIPELRGRGEVQEPEPIEGSRNEASAGAGGHGGASGSVLSDQQYLGAGGGSNTGKRSLVVTGAIRPTPERKGVTVHNAREEQMERDFLEWQELQLRYQYAADTGTYRCDD